MSYWSEWIELNQHNIRKFRWKGEAEPVDYRDEGTLLVYYENEKVSYNPILYGWFVLLSSVDDTELKSDILSGVICDMTEKSELLDQISNVMDLDDLEVSLLIRLHAVIGDSYDDYGKVSVSDFSPIVSCALLAFLMEYHRGRDRSDTWSRAAATHKSPTAEKIRVAYNGIDESKIEAMERIVQFASTTAQSKLPDPSMKP